MNQLAQSKEASEFAKVDEKLIANLRDMRAMLIDNSAKMPKEIYVKLMTQLDTTIVKHVERTQPICSGYKY